MEKYFRTTVYFPSLILLISLFFCISACKKKPTPPVVTTINITSVTRTSAVSGGNVTSDGGAALTARGICWGTVSNPTISNSKTTDGTGTGVFSSNITGLSPNSTYYIKAYATNSEGTGYGNELSFTTNPIAVGTITTTQVTSIKTTTAISGGNITDDGGSSITIRGVCWSTATNPTIADNKTSDGGGTGSFTSNLTGLAAQTTYHIRAYATNNAGTAYGSEVSFTTNTTAIPTLTTSSVTSITSSTAVSGGNITDDGGVAVTSRGVCWSTSTNPTIADNKTSNGIGSGIFTSNITGLTPATTYYVRAYATNNLGTAYGDELSFKSLVGLPVLTTSAISSVTSTSAVSGGNITSAGGGTISARGVCWGTSTNPTISGSHTSDGTGTGSFTSNITQLVVNTKYYLRAYATNEAGTSYGNQLSFTAINNPLLGKWTLKSGTFDGVPISDLSGYREFGSQAVSGGNWTGDSKCSMAQSTDHGTVWGAYEISGNSLIYGYSMTMISWTHNTTNFSKFGVVGLGLQTVTFSISNNTLTITGANRYGTTVLIYEK